MCWLPCSCSSDSFSTYAQRSTFLVTIEEIPHYILHLTPTTLDEEPKHFSITRYSLTNKCGNIARITPFSTRRFHRLLTCTSSPIILGSTHVHHIQIYEHMKKQEGMLVKKKKYEHMIFHEFVSSSFFVTIRPQGWGSAFKDKMSGIDFVK